MQPMQPAPMKAICASVRIVSILFAHVSARVRMLPAVFFLLLFLPLLTGVAMEMEGTMVTAVVVEDAGLEVAAEAHVFVRSSISTGSPLSILGAADMAFFLGHRTYLYVSCNRLMCYNNAETISCLM